VQSDRQLFFTPAEYFSGLIADINSAQQEIILETYIFKLDKVGNSVLEAMVDAVARGVELRLLIDGIGSYRDSSVIVDRLQCSGSEVRVFHPLPWDFMAYRSALKAGRWYSQVLHFFARINHRDHRKLCLVDQRIAWIGSYNVTADHANIDSSSSNDYWHDTGLRVTGEIVQTLADNFSQVWNRKTENMRQRSRQFLATSEVSRRRQPGLQLLRLLEQCQQRIWITNAYFNPSHRLLKILKQMAKQGVSVQLIVPFRSDVIFFPLLSRSFYTDLLQAKIRVYEYGHRVLHSKSMLIDEQVLVGSTNLNYRSLFHDLELDLVVDDPDIVTTMRQRFENDIANSIEITLRDWQRHPWLLRLLGWLSRFLRYWL
jgi:cardiolipin synthase